MKLDVQFEELNQKINVDLSNDHYFDISFGEIQQVTTIIRTDPYLGSYTVIPKVDSQILPTSQKRMTEDLTILEIPYYQTSNDQNGETVYIGSEVEIHGN